MMERRNRYYDDYTTEITVEPWRGDDDDDDPPPPPRRPVPRYDRDPPELETHGSRSPPRKPADSSPAPGAPEEEDDSQQQHGVDQVQPSDEKKDATDDGVDISAILGNLKLGQNSKGVPVNASVVVIKDLNVNLEGNTIESFVFSGRDKGRRS